MVVNQHLRSGRPQEVFWMSAEMYSTAVQYSQSASSNNNRWGIVGAIVRF